jgi:hypothetical protein
MVREGDVGRVGKAEGAAALGRSALEKWRLGHSYLVSRET